MNTEIEQNVNNDAQEDEISLLDLFAVLIRHRKLIIFGTLIVAVLAGLYLFVVPMVFKKANSQTAQVAYTVSVKSIPVSISSKLPDGSRVTPLYLASYNSQRLPFLVEQLKKNNVFATSETEMSAYEFNSFVQGLIKERKFQINESRLGNEFDIVLIIPIENIPKATFLVNSIVSDVDENLNNYFEPLFQTLLQNTTTALEKARTTTTGDTSAIQEVQNLNVDLQDFTENFDGFLTLHDEPFVIPEARGRTKKFIIIVFAAFFIFVFAAFCKNAIANIKADPDSNKLISDAWKAGK